MTNLHAVPDLPGRRTKPGPKGGPRVPSDAGPMLKSTWLEINEMGLSGREYDRWREIALAAAKTADNSIKDEKPAHFNPAIKVLTEAMDRLHALGNRQKEGGSDPLGGMGSFGAVES